jgi:phosphate-selective porin OprO/OprP
MSAHGVQSAAVLLALLFSTSPLVIPSPAAADGTVDAGPNGISLASTDGEFKLQIRGLLQVDGRLFFGDDVPGADDEMLIRRARLSFDGQFGSRLAFRIRPEASNGVTSVIDAYVDWKLGESAFLRVGKFKPPVGLERLQSANDLRMIERSFVTELVPSRDVGIQASDTIGFLTWEVALLNGVDDGRAADFNDDGEFELGGRVFFEPIRPGEGSNSNLGFGVGATTGDRAGTAQLPLLSGIRSPAQETVFRYRSGADGTYADGQRLRISPQIYWYSGPLGLMAEWGVSDNQVRRGAQSADIAHEAWQVYAEWNITGQDTKYRGFPPVGTVQLVVQASGFDIDDLAFEGGANSFADPGVAVSAARSAGIGINWFPLAGLKASVAYRHTAFDGGSSLGDRPDEQVLLARLQFAL